MNAELVLESPPPAIALGMASPKMPWINVLDRMPKDGELVHVRLEGSREIRKASRGRYQSTSAWFDANTHGPIYETIVHWKRCF